MLPDPGDAILVYLFRLFGQHQVLQVGSVKAHGKPGNAYKVTNSDSNPNTRTAKLDVKHVHLGPSHVQLVEDVFLDAGGGGRRQGHHRHLGELLTKLVQLLVVGAEIVAPLEMANIT